MTSLEIYECEQGTEEWYLARAGAITASCFKDVLTNPRKKDDTGLSETAKKYAYRVASERITGQPCEWYGNIHTERGTQYEDDAIAMFEAHTGKSVQKIGFMRRGNIGASADGLVGEKEGLEAKTRLAHLHVPLVLSNEVPKENYAQVQGNLYISGREVWHYTSYCPGMPKCIIPVERDEEFISELDERLHAFDAYVDNLVQQLMEKF